jgi:L-fuculose-phosphate aldolase
MSAKKLIVDAMKNLYSQKFISIRDGNVSFKPKNENFFYISAGSVKKNQINEDQVLKVDFYQKNLIYNSNYKYQPSREIRIHSLLQTYESNFDKDIFVIHAHPPNIISFIGTQKSNQLRNINDIFPEINVGKIGNNVKYHDAGSLDLANDCFNCLKDNDVVGLERHGSLSVGDDIDKIFEDLETLEYYIDIHLKSKLTFATQI